MSSFFLKTFILFCALATISIAAGRQSSSSHLEKYLEESEVQDTGPGVLDRFVRWGIPALGLAALAAFFGGPGSAADILVPDLEQIATPIPKVDVISGCPVAFEGMKKIVTQGEIVPTRRSVVVIQTENREAELILKALGTGSPYVAGFHGCASSQGFLFGESSACIIENFGSTLSTDPGNWGVPQIIRFTHDVLSGIQYMLSKNVRVTVTHADVRSDGSSFKVYPSFSGGNVIELRGFAPLDTWLTRLDQVFGPDYMRFTNHKAVLTRAVEQVVEQCRENMIGALQNPMCLQVYSTSKPGVLYPADFVFRALPATLAAMEKSLKDRNILTGRNFKTQAKQEIEGLKWNLKFTLSSSTYAYVLEYVPPQTGPTKTVPTRSSAKNVPTGGNAKNVPTGGSAKNVPIGGSAKNVPTGGSAKNVPTGGSTQTDSYNSATVIKNDYLEGSTHFLTPHLDALGLEKVVPWAKGQVEVLSLFYKDRDYMNYVVRGFEKQPRVESGSLISANPSPVEGVERIVIGNARGEMLAMFEAVAKDPHRNIASVLKILPNPSAGSSIVVVEKIGEMKIASNTNIAPELGLNYLRDVSSAFLHLNKLNLKFDRSMLLYDVWYDGDRFKFYPRSPTPRGNPAWDFSVIDFKELGNLESRISRAIHRIPSCSISNFRDVIDEMVVQIVERCEDNNIPLSDVMTRPWKATRAPSMSRGILREQIDNAMLKEGYTSKFVLEALVVATDALINSGIFTIGKDTRGSPAWISGDEESIENMGLQFRLDLAN